MLGYRKLSTVRSFDIENKMRAWTANEIYLFFSIKMKLKRYEKTKMVSIADKYLKMKDEIRSEGDRLVIGRWSNKWFALISGHSVFLIPALKLQTLTCDQAFL